jgi:DNA-directed RNA polymerase subunit RPC12/RpoP
MSQVIDQLAELFNQRRELDARILELAGGGQLVESPLKRRGHKHYGTRKWGRRLGRPPKVRDYACEDCKKPFKSNLKLRDAKCPDCLSTKILEVK